MNSLSIWTRRDFVRIGLASAGAASAWAAIPGTARAAGGTVNFADIGVGDPGGDWSLFTKAANGWNVNLVAIGMRRRLFSTSWSPAVAPQATT